VAGRARFEIKAELMRQRTIAQRTIALPSIVFVCSAKELFHF
jgi:hypothetical protein